MSLLETPDSLRDWVHSHEALQQTDTFLASAAQVLNDRGLDWFDPPHVHPARTTAGGHGGSGVWDGRILKDVAVAFDGAGLAGVRFGGQRPDGSGVYYLMSLDARDRWVQIALAFLLGSLEQAGAYGPALVRWNLYGIRNADVMTVREAMSSLLRASFLSTTTTCFRSTLMRTLARLARRTLRPSCGGGWSGSPELLCTTTPSGRAPLAARKALLAIAPTHDDTAGAAAARQLRSDWRFVLVEADIR